MRVFSNAQDHSRCTLKVAIVPQIVLALGVATSGAASTSVIDLNAATEVKNTYNNII